MALSMFSKYFMKLVPPINTITNTVRDTQSHSCAAVPCVYPP